MTMKEVPGREVIQEDRMMKAVQEVQEGLIRRGKPFSSLLSAELKDMSRLRIKEIGKETGATDRTLVHWAQYGSRDISKLANVCRALDIDANYLLGLIGERKTLSDQQLSEAFDGHAVSSCPTCGTTELLCGHGGVGCTSEK